MAFLHDVQGGYMLSVFLVLLNILISFKLIDNLLNGFLADILKDRDLFNGILDKLNIAVVVRANIIYQSLS